MILLPYEIPEPTPGDYDDEIVEAYYKRIQHQLSQYREMERAVSLHLSGIKAVWNKIALHLREIDTSTRGLQLLDNREAEVDRIDDGQFGPRWIEERSALIDRRGQLTYGISVFSEAAILNCAKMNYIVFPNPNPQGLDREGRKAAKEHMRRRGKILQHILDVTDSDPIRNLEYRHQIVHEDERLDLNLLNKQGNVIKIVETVPAYGIWRDQESVSYRDQIAGLRDSDRFVQLSAVGLLRSAEKIALRANVASLALFFWMRDNPQAEK